MQPYDNDVYKQKIDNFGTIWKRIEPYRRNPLTKNSKLLDEYKTDIVRTYNSVVSYICEHYSNVDEAGKKKFLDRIENLRGKIVEAFEILNLRYDWTGDIYTEVILEDISTIDSVDDENQIRDNIDDSKSDDDSSDNMALTKAEIYDTDGATSSAAIHKRSHGTPNIHQQCQLFERSRCR